MALAPKFDYEQFRHQAVEQLRTGPINLASIRDLLAPVVQDLLEMALQSTDQPVPPASRLAKPTAVEDITVDPDQSVEHPNDTLSSIDSPLEELSSGNLLPYDPRLDSFIIERFYQGVPYKIIQRQFAEQGWDVSKTTLMTVTNQDLPRVEAWHKRPLFPMYPFLWVSSVPFQLWQGSPLTHLSAYVVATIDLQGRRDIIGYYVGGQDLSQTWSTLLTDLQERGVEDILIACGEEPVTLREAFSKTYPQTHVHGCVMFQMRASLRALSGPDKTAATKVLRALYRVTDQTQAAEIWQGFRAEWVERYPLLVESWEHNWPQLTGPMQYPALVARRAQRLNLVDTLHQVLLSQLKAHGPYTNEQEFVKSTYIISQRILPKRQGIVGNWGLMLEQLASVFDHRIKKYLVSP